MATAPASRPQLPSTAAATLALATTCVSARASTLAAPNCTTAGGDLACRLAGVLHILYIIAVILACVLIAVIALAVHLYRKNKADDERRRP